MLSVQDRELPGSPTALQPYRLVNLNLFHQFITMFTYLLPRTRLRRLHFQPSTYLLAPKRKRKYQFSRHTCDTSAPRLTHGQNATTVCGVSPDNAVL